MPIQQISPAEAAVQKGVEGVIYQSTANPTVFWGKGATGYLVDHPVSGGLTSAQATTVADAVATTIGGVRVFAPIGLNFPVALIPKIWNVGGYYYTDAVPRDFTDAACFTGPAYMVDPVAGSDANPGTGAFDGDFATAFATIGKAITVGNATAAPYRVILNGGTTYKLQDILFSGAPVFPTQSVAFMGFGATRAIVSVHSDPTWALDTGTTYTGTIPNTTLASVPGGRVVDMANLNAFGSFGDLTSVASAALCRTTPGSYFLDTSVTPNGIYANRTDGSAVTAANTRVYVRQRVNGCQNTLGASHHIYLQNVEYHGGEGNGTFVFDPRNATSVLGAYNCAFLYSGQTGGNGLSITSGKFAFIHTSEATANQSDGFNTHDNTNGTTGYGTATLTVLCVGYDNGRTSSTSCNGLTSHDGVPSIDIMGRYYNNYGSNIAPVSISAVRPIRTQLWCLGSYGGASFGNPPGTGTTLKYALWNSSADVWLEGVTLADPTFAIHNDTAQTPTYPARTFTRNSTITGPVSTTGTGSLQQAF